MWHSDSCDLIVTYLTVVILTQTPEPEEDSRSKVINQNLHPEDFNCIPIIYPFFVTSNQNDLTKDGGTKDDQNGYKNPDYPPLLWNISLLE